MIRGPGQDPSALFARAMQLHKAGNFGEALQFYQRVLVMRPLSANALTYSAIALLELGRVREAAERLQASLAVRPKDAETLGYLGNALQLSGRLDEAEQAFRAALAITPANPRLLNNHGILLLEAKRYEEAQASFERALAANPSYGEASRNLSQVWLKLGQGERAVEAARHAVACGAGNAQAHNQMGNALAECGRYDEAIAAYRQATALQPRFVDALDNLAVALVAAGRPVEALEVTEGCLRIQPGGMTALATRSVALGAAGDTQAQDRLVDFERLLVSQRVDPGPGYSSLAAFNQALAAHIRGHPSLRYAPAGHATRNGLHSGSLLAEPKGPVADLERIIAACFERYVAALPADLTHPFLDSRPEQWILDIWALVLDRQGYQVPHIHPSGWLSGVYYVAVDNAVSSEEAGHEGWIEFGRPQTIYRPTRDPRLKLMRPEEGMMVLFPSFFFHRTIPFAADAQRICVAFDICPKVQAGPGG